MDKISQINNDAYASLEQIKMIMEKINTGDMKGIVPHIDYIKSNLLDIAELSKKIIDVLELDAYEKLL